MFYKKADVGLGAIIIIIIIVLFLGWLVNEGWKECRIESDCKSDQYCTSQFECKDIPVMKSSAPSQGVIGDYGAPIIGISLIAAALIMKWDTLFKGKKNKKAEYINAGYNHNAEEQGLYEDDLDKELNP